MSGGAWLQSCSDVGHLPCAVWHSAWVDTVRHMFDINRFSHCVLHAAAKGVNVDVDLRADGAVPVNVNLVRNGGDYVAPPKPAYTAFSGQGRTLTGAAPFLACSWQLILPPSAAGKSQMVILWHMPSCL